MIEIITYARVGAQPVALVALPPHSVALPPVAFAVSRRWYVRTIGCAFISASRHPSDSEPSRWMMFMVDTWR